MQVVKEQRADIMIRSLSKAQQNQINRSLSALSTTDAAELRPSLPKLPTSRTDAEFFVYRGSPSLRLILSLSGDTWTVEDVIDKERLAGLFPQLD